MWCYNIIIDILLMWFRLSSFLLVKTYQNRAHVIHSILTRTVLWDELIHQFFNYSLARNLFCNSFAYPFHHLTITFHLPYTITPHYYKIYTLRPHLRYIRIGSYHLLLWLKPRLFILQVADGSGEIQTTIHPTIIYNTSRLCYTIEFYLILRFMIFT